MSYKILDEHAISLSVSYFLPQPARHGRDGLLLLHLGSAPTLVVSSPSAAEAVLRTHNHVLASRTWSPVADIIFYGLTDVAFAPYGERWRQARKLLTTHMLSAKKVHSFRHGRLEEVRVVLARIRDAAATAPRTAVDMTGLLGGYTNDVVSRAVLGESHREGSRNRLFGELSEINVSLLLAKLELLRKLICAKAKRVHRRWDQLFDKLIDEHQRERKRASSSQHEQQEEITDQDFIHVLLSVREEYGLTMDGVKAILVDMFEAGIETAHLKEVRRCAPAGNDMVVMEEDLSNMAYLKAVVKETLRLHPPVPLLVPHLSIADCEVNGYPVPSGTRVFVNVWSLGRDPVYWERPEEFMPERFLEGGCAVDVDMKGKDFQFLPFGSGRRICPGINFGVATVEIMLANLMYHFDWDLQDEMEGAGKGVDMTELFGLTLRRKEKLILLVPKMP
ncbi:hypothetical protein GQ55_6G004100 [Panicum hallii var. hallii]|uniref:Uncharacterized protein n=1 Tax=Panicum hallii var. hallii TaxID=1504633 RepID=A0A2T7D2C8_9POAL|nr:hypothetical protein GQ55_6G004100 [Panicum hallii var. hallii]